MALELSLGAFAGLLYSLLFRAWRRTGFRAGLLIAIPQWGISGVLVGLLSAWHPLIPDEFLGPGFFEVQDRLSGFLTFLAAHLLFGAVVGEVHAFALEPRGKHRAGA